MKIHKSDIPQDILNRHKALQYMDTKGYVYFKITKGMYGLKQAAILAFDQPKKNLNNHGYNPIPHTVEMWKHQLQPTTFISALCFPGSTTHPPRSLLMLHTSGPSLSMVTNSNWLLQQFAFPLLPPAEVGELHYCNGSRLLFYSRAVDHSILPTMNEISTQQANPTEATVCKSLQLLNYVAPHPNAVTQYHKSDMVLHVDIVACGGKLCLG